MKKNINLYMFAALFILPLILLWFLAPTSQLRFDTLNTTLASLGQLSSLIAVVLMALSFVLSSRIKVFDQLFYGLNNVYVKHSEFGQIAFILLLLHPLLLLTKYSRNISESARFLWFSSDWSMNWGILALGIMIFLVVLTLYLKPRYDIWKLTHKFMGLVFLLSAIHIWMVPSDTSTYIPLRIYIFGIVGVGLLAYAYRSLLSRITVQRYTYTVTEVNRVNEQTTELKLVPQGEKLNYLAGQFAFVHFEGNQIGSEQHPYSFTSIPGNSHISFLIKELGDYTYKIGDIKPGAVAMVEGAYGTFSHENASETSQIWIAGGIGVTPFISLARSLTSDSPYKIDFIYSVRNESELSQIEELNSISQDLPGVFRIIPYYSEGNGHLSADKIERMIGKFSGKDVLICGPVKMIQSLRSGFVSKGVHSDSIYTEEFSF